MLVVYGGNSEDRIDGQIKERAIVKNTYSLNQGKPNFGEVLGNYLDSEIFKVFNPLFPNPADANYFEWARFLGQVLSIFKGKYEKLFLLVTR